MFTIDLFVLILGGLLIISIFASKISDRIGIPALLLFLAIGMLAGSDGPGGIYFDNVPAAQMIGVVALALILFSGGLDTNWTSIRPILPYGAALASLGVLITAGVVGGVAYWLLDFSILESLLLGAIVSSTDAAAVFSILRARGVSLKGYLRPILELESGSNDPMAVFLTLAFIQLIANPGLSPVSLVPGFIIQMGVGAALGYGIGRMAMHLLNGINLRYDGLYPVLALTVALITYGLAGSLGGSGFLAVYLAGLTLGNGEFIHRRSIMRFFDGLAWLMQITMFLALGLLVFPSQLQAVALPGMLIATILIILARPVGVFASLLTSRLRLREKTFIAWVGLRGASPIVLATFPLIAGIARAETMFNLVFFVVLTSVLVQGPTLPLAARLLKVARPDQERQGFVDETASGRHLRGLMRELPISSGSPLAGKRIVDMHLPADFLVILIHRGEDYIIASGASEIEAGDSLLVIASEEVFGQVQAQAGGEISRSPSL